MSITLHAKQKHIFLVEDDPDDKSIFMEALECIECHVTVTYCYDGINAFEKITEPDFIAPDIIFLDLNMPRMGGIPFLEALRKQNLLGQTPIIIHSTSSLSRELTRLSELGIAFYMYKKNSFKDLCIELRDVLAKHSNILT